MQILGNGQSLSTGENMAPTTVTQPYANLSLYDSRGVIDGYVLSEPTAPTLSLIPLVSPERAVNPNPGQYGFNINGQDVAVQTANQLTALYLVATGVAPVVTAMSGGVGGAPLTGIGPASGIYECQAVAARPPGYPAGKTFGTVGITFDHGETDGVNYSEEGLTTPTTYLDGIIAMQSAYQSGCGAVSGQSNKGNIPMFLCPTASSPGAMQGFNLTAWACLLAAQENPGLFVFSGPKYQYVHSGFHLNDYRQRDEKHAQAIFKYLTGQDTDPLWMTGASLSGSTVTFQYHVPQGPLALDTATLLATSGLPAPHQSGTWAAWANGLGFEAWDHVRNVSNVSGVGVSPIQVTFETAHGLTTGQTYTIQAVQDATGGSNALGTWTVTVVDAFNVTLDGSSAAAGAYTAGTGQGFMCVQITSVSVSGDAVVMVLGRTPGTDLMVGYAQQTDVGQPVAYGLLRDSDPFVGLSLPAPLAGVPLLQPLWCNWAVQEFHSLPYAIP